MQFWTDEKIEAMIELWQLGNSMKEIQDLIGAPTRASVCSRLKRMGFSSKKRSKNISIPAPASYRVCPPSRQSTPVEIKQPRIKAAEAGISLLDLQSWHCRWPLGEKMEAAQKFCGAVKMSGSSYCCEHHAVGKVMTSRQITSRLRAA